MNDIMVDLETVGTVPGCGVLSIGAVFFDREGLGATFYSSVSLADCHRQGLTSSSDTLAWWAKQSPEARKVFDEAYSPDAPNVSVACHAFNLFITDHRDSADVRVWGNGASFDNAILAAFYDSVGVRPAWKFYNDRCYRTLKAFAPNVELIRHGTHHNAVDDAKSQAEHAVRLINHLGLTSL